MHLRPALLGLQFGIVFNKQTKNKKKRVEEDYKLWPSYKQLKKSYKHFDNDHDNDKNRS